MRDAEQFFEGFPDVMVVDRQPSPRPEVACVAAAGVAGSAGEVAAGAAGAEPGGAVLRKVNTLASSSFRDASSSPVSSMAIMTSGPATVAKTNPLALLEAPLPLKYTRENPTPF